jgi:hypothetical protein
MKLLLVTDSEVECYEYSISDDNPPPERMFDPVQYREDILRYLSLESNSTSSVA